MQPVNHLAAALLPDQRPAFEIRVWDTPYAALAGDLASAGLGLRVWEPVDDTWGDLADDVVTYSQAMGASLEDLLPHGSATAIVADGRTSLVQAYWGSGAPNWWGASQTGQVLVSWSGTVVGAAERAWFGQTLMRFAVAGSGYVRIEVGSGASRRTVFAAELRELTFLQEGLLQSDVVALSDGLPITIYYLQRGTEPWGGVVVKAVPGDSPTDDEVAKAPVLSAGLLSAEQLTYSVLPFVTSVEVSHERGSASTARIQVPLLNPQRHDGHGWEYQRSGGPDGQIGTLVLWEDGAEQYALRRKRLIQVRALLPDASYQPTEALPVFTGFVDDYSDTDDGTATIACVGLEGRLVEQYEQAPDRISYMARGFRLLDYTNAPSPEIRAQPVYNVPAFDNWPLAWALEELALRAGVDPSRFRQPLLGLTAAGQATSVQYPWDAAPLRFQGVTTSGVRLRLPRAVHYGNVGLSFTESRPVDDPYRFPVEPTKDLWARARELSDKVGYRFRFDETGAAELFPANRPSHVVDWTVGHATVGTPVKVTHPSAYGGTYLTCAGATTVEMTVQAARIDLSVPLLGTHTGAWSVTVRQGATVVATTTISPNPAVAGPVLLFNAPVLAAGDNATVVKVFTGAYDTYTVTVASTGGGTQRVLDCVLCYATDPDQSLLPEALSTDGLAIKVRPRAQQDEMRNKVTIVGRRKATLTDSEKLGEASQPTEQEFVVQNAVDVRSITDPTADNFVGYPKQAVIYDDTIADDGFARYLANVLIHRQRLPKPGAEVEAPVLPMLQVGDPVLVRDSRFQVVVDQSALYIRKLSHRWNATNATTTLEAESWPDYPAYEPRTDIDLAEFNNLPVTGITLTYPTLSGHTATNLGPDDYVVAKDLPYPDGVLVDTGPFGVPVTSPGGQDSLEIPAPGGLGSGYPWPPVPGTLQLRPSDGLWSPTASTTGVVTSLVLSGAKRGSRFSEVGLPPYVQITSVVVQVLDASQQVVNTVAVPSTNTRKDPFWYTVQNRTSFIGMGSFVVLAAACGDTFSATNMGGTRFQVRVEWGVPALADPTGWMANTPYHEFVSVDYTEAGRTIPLTWRHGDETAAYARNTDRPGYQVRYRALGDDPYPEQAGRKYSPFYDPYTSELGKLVRASFDVLADGEYRVSIRSVSDDTTVAWLTNPTGEPDEPEKHWEYLTVGSDRHFYWDGVDQIGRWNADQSELYATLVEGVFEDGRRPRVGRGFYCWNQEVSHGELAPMAFVWMEQDPVTGRPYIGQGTFARWYLHIEAVTDPVDTVVETKSEDPKFILTHLPEPTKVRLKVEDWNGDDYDPDGVNPNDWVALDQVTAPSEQQVFAYIHNARPVRLRFQVQPRPGYWWTNQTGEATIKLTRHVHLRTVVGDQSVIYKGIAYPGTAHEQRTLVNRRLVNDEHTNTYTDAGYRKAKTLRWADNDPGVTEWVFLPQEFEREFTFAGRPEPLEFGNYLQLEEVPGWNPSRSVGSSRSRLHFALMSYLWYLSAYATDRSGRSSWALNTDFVDRSKQVTNTEATSWPDDPVYEHRRTMVCRQWTREPGWKDAQLAQFGYSTNTLFARLLEHFWWQHEATSPSIGTGLTNWSAFALGADPYSQSHTGMTAFKLPTAYGPGRQLGTHGPSQAVVTHLGSVAGGGSETGSWTWETAPSWMPSITRDLHPYFRLPPMISPPFVQGAQREAEMRLHNFYTTVEGDRPYVQATNEGADAAAAEVWNSPVYDLENNSTKRFWPGRTVDPAQGPMKNALTAYALDYLRQDEMVHFEEVRGMYSRGARPMEPPKKLVAGSPYYLNPMRYYGMTIHQAYKNPGYPRFQVKGNTGGGLDLDWHRIAFRHEYLVESGTLFPVTNRGAEMLGAVRWWKTRFQKGLMTSSVQYDTGAWTGWKDDVPLSLTALEPRVLTEAVEDDFARTYTPFDTGHMVAGVGTRLPQTTELVAHLILVPERRGA